MSPASSILRQKDVSSPDATGRELHLRLHSVTVYVRDQDQSLRFYVDQLGFNLVGEVRLPTYGRFIAVAPPDGTAILILVKPEAGSKESKLIGRAIPISFVTEDVVAKFREWRKRGVQFLNTPRLRRIKYETKDAASSSPDAAGGGAPGSVWGTVFTRFKDIDGNSFALVSFDALSREIEAQRRADIERRESERRAAQELEIARQVQAGLFPQSQPPMRTLEYAGLCIQARAVGGDYYDFLDLGRGRLGLVVGDISGKGIAAALLMANLQANLRSQCASAWNSPQRFLQSVNKLFFENTTGTTFSTLFFAEYDDSSCHLRYANCGNPAALLLRRNGDLERLESTSTVVGMFKDWECSTEKLRLGAGDTLVLYTDGVTESFNEEDEEYGEPRLIDALRRCRREPATNLLASLVEDIRKFGSREQHDDITLIVAKVSG